MSTHFFTEKEVPKCWYVIDAKDKILGHVAQKAAEIIMGKNKPEFTPNADVGDYVIITNASKVKLSGNKELKKIYYHHSGYIGGLKKTPVFRQRKKDASRMIYKAVWGMIKSGSLGRKQLKKLHVFNHAEHKHTAQNPVQINI